MPALRARQAASRSTAERVAGYSLRDVQDFACYADLDQTRGYDRARGALDCNPTYIVATHLAGGPAPAGLLAHRARRPQRALRSRE
jgi:hypothetical protein